MNFDLVRLSPTALWAYAIVSILGSLASTLPQGNELVRAVLYAIASTAVVTVLGLALTAQRLSGAATLAVISALGVVRGAVLLALEPTFAIIDEATAAFRLLNSTLSTTLLLSISSILITAGQHYRVQYAQLFTDAMNRAAAQALDQQPEVMRMRNTLRSISNLDASDTGLLQQAAERIRDEITDQLRPLSHRIWFDAQRPLPRYRLGRLLRDGIFAFRIPTWPTAAIWIGLASVGGLLTFEVRRAVIAGFASGLLLVLLLTAIHAFLQRRRSLAMAMVSLLMCASLPVTITDFLIQMLGYVSLYSLAPSLAVIVHVSLLGLVLSAATFGLVTVDREAVLELLQRTIDQQSGAPTSAQTASYLHNSLQSELTGLAMQLDAAARTGDRAEALQILERVQAIVHRSLAEDLATLQETSTARIDRLISAWSGIASISVDVATDVEPSTAAFATAVQVIEETVANAVRHGAAATIHATIHHHVHDLLVTISGDGNSALIEGRGLGSSWLDTVSRGGWSIESTETGFTLTVPLATGP